MAGTQNQPLEYEQLSYNAPDGAQFGRAASDKVGFYGATPVIQYGTAVGAASTFIITTNTTATFGLDSSAAVSTLVFQVSTINQALRGYGLIT